MAEAKEEHGNGYWRDALFYLTFFYFTVGYSPYISLSSTYTGSAMAAGSSLLNQFTAIVLLFSFILFMAKERSFSLIFAPRLWMVAIFGWYAFTSLVGEAPMFSLRRLVMCAIIFVLAAGFLQLPRTERHFSTLLAVCTLAILFLCYFGVIVLPSRSIHQASDALEPLLAGDWRGVFRHKNEAASVMSILIIVGVYLCKKWSFVGGLAVFLLSLVFLVKSGGKTALGLMPIIFSVGWFILRWPKWRYTVVAALLAVFATVTVGTTVDPVFSAMLAKLGMDPTFTGRTDIWTVSIEYIRQSPLLGYGYQAFWRSDALMSSFTENNTWATSAPDSHNGYFDLLLAAGVPGLVLVLIWIFLLPLYYLGKMSEAVRKSPLTRFYVSIWLYTLLYGFLETLFMLSTGFVWFFIIVAIVGLHLQAHASLVEDEEVAIPIPGKVKGIGAKPAAAARARVAALPD
ncbi:O-antigen ligase family protein [Agrobacterium sp. NPDC090273]|uniref:O-antigen ligase family protein n=1 Tax=Agrobacterium sp. NPDC090273 TaxID=3363919 RepID=UPI00383B8670